VLLIGAEAALSFRVEARMAHRSSTICPLTVAGRFVDRTELDTLLAQAKVAATEQ
jgi:hypothetical protein